MISVLDPEMDVERQICELANNRDDSRAEGNVIDEMSIHDVAMNPIGPGLLNPANFIGQSGKIGGEDGWGDKDPMHGAFEYLSIEVMECWAEYITPLLQHSITPRLGCSKLSLDGWQLCSKVLRVFGR